jgi:ATP-binding protein involved in chromosome partitioning
VSRRFRTYADLGEAGGGDLLQQVQAQHDQLARRLAGVGHVVVVASGKGGVGKSMVSANLAAALAAAGHRVGALDADVHGPSLALMLGAARTPLRVDDEGVHPAPGAAGTRVMSMDLLLATPDAAVRWHEPADGAFVWQSTLEAGVLREFLADVVWGSLDYLIIDLPPGTDKIARLLSFVPAPAALLLVCTPSHAAGSVVARSVTHARDSGVPTVALVSNMDGFTCAGCGAVTPLYEGGGAAELAQRYDVPVWGDVPFEPALATATDAGTPYVLTQPDAPAARALRALATRLADHTGARVPT